MFVLISNINKDRNVSCLLTWGRRSVQISPLAGLNPLLSSQFMPLRERQLYGEEIRYRCSLQLQGPPLFVWLMGLIDKSNKHPPVSWIIQPWFSSAAPTSSQHVSYPVWCGSEETNHNGSFYASFFFVSFLFPSCPSTILFPANCPLPQAVR